MNIRCHINTSRELVWVLAVSVPGFSTPGLGSSADTQPPEMPQLQSPPPITRVTSSSWSSTLSAPSIQIQPGPTVALSRRSEPNNSVIGQGKRQYIRLRRANRTFNHATTNTIANAPSATTPPTDHPAPLSAIASTWLAGFDPVEPEPPRRQATAEQRRSALRRNWNRQANPFGFDDDLSALIDHIRDHLAPATR